MPAMRAILREMLESIGTFEVVEWEDGESAWNALQSCDPVPQLLLLDVVLPGMNGLDLVRAIRGLSRLENMRILMVTSEGRLDHVEEAGRVGADSYLVKPFDSQRLKDAVGPLIGDME
jgi:DNA-binding response OmpR family regulator